MKQNTFKRTCSKTVLAATKVLGADFVIETMERIGVARDLTYGRRIKIDEGTGLAYYQPVGPHAQKNIKHKRLQRGYEASRKYLTAAWTTKLQRYIAKYLPVLKAYKEKQVGWVDNIQPPPKAGKDIFSLFSMLNADEFRRQAVGQVLKGKTTDARALMELELFIAAKEEKIHKNVVQAHTGHSHKVSLKYYKTAQRDAMRKAVMTMLEKTIYRTDD